MTTSSPRHLTVLTGASRGMGAAMARQLVAQGHALLCISRGTDAALASLAQAAGVPLEQWAADLADPGPVAGRLAAWLSAQAGPWETVNLINNAGVVPRIAALAQTPAAEIAIALRVGLEAPMALTGAFLGATQDWKARRRVLGISSGLGRRAMASQGPYCAAKAGMDHFTRCLALEEARRENGARVCSLAPGVIDTGMQTHLRSADETAFPDVQGFRNMKEQGMLTTPEAAAARVLAWLERADFGKEPVADVRDA